MGSVAWGKYPVDYWINEYPKTLFRKLWCRKCGQSSYLYWSSAPVDAAVDDAVDAAA
jgi:hypothetical protein